MSPEQDDQFSYHTFGELPEIRLEESHGDDDAVMQALARVTEMFRSLPPDDQDAFRIVNGAIQTDILNRAARIQKDVGGRLPWASGNGRAHADGLAGAATAYNGCLESLMPSPTDTPAV